MRKLVIALALLAVPAGVALAKAPAKKAAAVPSDWSRVVRKTGWGGYVMGNPAAPAKLVEYGSLTCGHCAAFERDHMADVLAAVRGGKVSYEFRQWTREPLDTVSGLVARCAGDQGYFAAQAALFADMPRTIRANLDIPDAVRARFVAAGPTQEMQSIAELSGLRALGLRLGMPAARLDSCLASSAERDRLASMKAQGELLGVEGTPTFFLNGKEVVPTQMDRWPDLARAIDAVIAG